MASVRLLLFVLLLAMAEAAPRADQPIMLPISTDKNGQYFLPISIGTPPKTFLVQIDTRSAALAVPDQTCAACAAAFRYGGAISSSSARYVNCTQSCKFCATVNTTQQCGVSIYYSQEQQITGMLWNDVITVGNVSVTGTLMSFTSSYESRLLDGVLGLAYESVAVGPQPTLLSSLVQAGTIEDVFSLCLGIYGGYFALGGSDTRFYRPEALLETPIVVAARYVIRTHALHISGTPVTGAYNPTVIDTTTQHVLLLPAPAFEQFYGTFVTKYCSPPNYLFGACQTDRRLTIWAGQCFDFTDEQLAQYPTLNILFEASGSDASITLPLEPRDYLIEDQTGFRCLDIQPHTNSEIGALVLGARWMQKYYTIFNRKERRIGFAPAMNCTGARFLLRQLSGNDQSGTVSTQLKSFRVQVLDLASNASAGDVPVKWTVLKGRGVLSATETRTDSEGIASVTLTLGETSGTNMVIAAVELALNSPLPFVAEGKQSVIITVFSFLTAFLVAALLTLVFFLNRRIVKSRNSAANTSFSLLMDSRRSFSPQRVRTDVNNSALLLAEDE